MAREQSGEFRASQEDGRKYFWEVESYTLAGDLERLEGKIPFSQLKHADYIYVEITDSMGDRFFVTIYGPYTNDAFIEGYLGDFFNEEEYGEAA